MYICIPDYLHCSVTSVVKQSVHDYPRLHHFTCVCVCVCVCVCARVFVMHFVCMCLGGFFFFKLM